MIRALEAVGIVMLIAAVIMIVSMCRPGPWRRTRSWFDIPHHVKISSQPIEGAPREQPRTPSRHRARAVRRRA